MKKFISVFVCFAVLLSIFMCTPMNISAASEPKTLFSSDFANDKSFSNGFVTDDPTDTGAKVLGLPYKGLGNGTLNNEKMITPQVEGYEYYGLDSSSLQLSGNNDGFTTITFDLYVDKFNTTSDQIWRGVFGNEARFTAVSVKDEDGNTHNVYTRGVGGRWVNIAGLAKSDDNGETAYLMDSRSELSAVKLEKQKWYTIKNVVDLKNLTQCMYISENGGNFKAVEFSAYGQPAKKWKYADAYHTKINNIGFEDVNKCSFNTVVINNKTYYTDTTCTYDESNYSKNFNTFQFMWIAQKYTCSETAEEKKTYTKNDFTPATGTVNHYVANVIIQACMPLEDAINKAETVSDVEQYLKYYSDNGSIKLNSLAEFYDVNDVYEELLNKNFKSAAEVQAAYDNAVAKYDMNNNDYILKINNTASDGSPLVNIKIGDTFNTAVRFTNNTDNDATVTVINAMYSDDKSLIDLKVNVQKAEGGKKTSEINFSTAVPSNTDISYVKQFVVDTVDLLTPYCSSGIIYCAR